MAHLEIQARTMAAQAALAQLDDGKTDALLPEIRNQLAMINETLLSLGVYGAAARVSSSDTDV